MRVDWTKLKSFMSSRNVGAHYIEFDDYYLIKSYDNLFSLTCILSKSPTDMTDLNDWNNNYKSTANSSFTDSNGIALSRTRAFNSSDGYKFRGTGVKGTITKNTTGNIDYKLTEDRMLNGVQLFLENHVWADTVKFQVIDIDNILGYGANFVADEFATTWNIDPSMSSQRPEMIQYPAKVIKDLYIRVVYTSTGTANDVKVGCNHYLHKVPA